MTQGHSGDHGSWDTEVLRRLGPSAAPSASSAGPSAERAPGRGGRVTDGAGPGRHSAHPGEPAAGGSLAAERLAAGRLAAEPLATTPLPEGETGSSPWQSRLSRRLARRHGTPPWRRRLGVLAGVLRSDDGPERRTRATARCQTAVSTGRRVAVVSAHGGAGGTTLTVGLGLVLAAIRNDAVAVVAGRSDRQVLGHRLGCAEATSTRAVRDLLVAHRSDPNIASLDHLAVPGAPGLRAATRSDDPAVVADAADHLSRRHAVTLVDTGPVVGHAVLGSTHSVVVVGRLSLDGVAQVHEVLGELVARLPSRRLQVVLMESGHDTGVSLAAAQALLEDHGLPVEAVPADLHLAAGSPVSLAHLSEPASVALTEIAASVLDVATAAP